MRHHCSKMSGARHMALTVRAAEVPGGKAALPLKRTWNVTLRPGQALDLARARSSYGGEGSGPNAIPLGLAIAAAAALFLLTGARLGRHRRATVSVR